MNIICQTILAMQMTDVSDDLTQSGSRSQSEHVLGAKECLYTLEVYLVEVTCVT